MKHVDRITELGDINDPECSGGIPDANLVDTLANRWHRFPVIRLQPLSNPVKLMASNASGFFWEDAQVC